MSFEATVERLSRLSVERHTHAADLPWEEPEFRLDPDRFGRGLPDFDPLTATAWYRSLSPEEAARLALHRYVACMKIGAQFENLLQRGLLRFAMDLPDGAPEFRYLHHEVVEESEHSMMFAEFVARSGVRLRGMPRLLVTITEVAVLPLARRFPALFFLFVLGGEEPVDTLQRRHLAAPGSTHPLIERIMRVHVAEEARHLSFARHYLEEKVPRLGRFGRARLAVEAPIVLGVMARLMLRPPGDLVRRFGIPRATLHEAFGSPEGRRMLADSVARTRRLWEELGLVGPGTSWLWRAAGLVAWEPGA